MTTFKLVDNIGDEVGGNGFFVFEERVNGVAISEYESENSFWVASFEDFVQFFPCVIAGEAIVGEANVMEGGFF